MKIKTGLIRQDFFVFSPEYVNIASMRDSNMGKKAE
jgi:hypothetical protein